MLSNVPRTALYAISKNQILKLATPLASLLNLKRHRRAGYEWSSNLLRGIDFIRDPRLNKGLAFTLEERQALGIHGLLAPKFKTQKDQLEICKIAVDRYENNLNKYIYLVELQDACGINTSVKLFGDMNFGKVIGSESAVLNKLSENDNNEKLFFNLLAQNVEKYMPIVYTPTVGLACQKFGLVYRNARGLFISINDKGNVHSVIKNWPEKNVKAICFTDGERILGLGDLGAYGMGIPVGKLALYTALAGIQPHHCLPITLDVGTDNQSLLEDPLYIGLRQKRVRGEMYDEFIDEFMKACIRRFGANVLLQFEDFAMSNASRLLAKYRDRYCTFNDDIQGTASVAVAGLMAASRISKKKLSENIYMFLGAGSAATGIANLIVLAMQNEGLKEKEARDKIFLFDIDGLVTISREAGAPETAKPFAKDVKPEKNFEVCLQNNKPTCLIGCSTVSGAFTPNVLKIMAKNAERPIIFALSNPTSKAECTAQAAYDNTEGRCIFASGSPFPPVKYNGKEYITGQGNNAYIFPGVALGVLTTVSHRIPESMFLEAAKSLAKYVKEDDLEVGRIYPSLSQVRDVSFVIAVNVAKLAYDEDVATLYPKPKNIEKAIKRTLYNFKYDTYLPRFYKYPDPPPIKMKSMEEAYRKNMLVLLYSHPAGSHGGNNGENLIYLSPWYVCLGLEVIS